MKNIKKLQKPIAEANNSFCIPNLSKEDPDFVLPLKYSTKINLFPRTQTEKTNRKQVCQNGVEERAKKVLEKVSGKELWYRREMGIALLRSG